MTGRRMLGRLPVIVGLLWAGLASPVSAQTTSFGTATLYDNGSDTTGLAVADINQDGHLDLLVAACDSGILRIRLGVGDGTFGAETDYAIGDEGDVSLFGLAVADFNGDNHPDVAVGDVIGDRVFILINDGTGLFAAPVPYDVGASPQAIGAADFNGDNVSDLAVVNSFSDDVTILINAGDGTFTEHADSPIPVGFFPYSLRVADINGDNHPDLIVPNVAEDTVSILLGAGGGSFVPADSIELSSGTAPVDVAILDFNGDTVPDIAILGGDIDEMLLYAGNGDGTFAVVTPSTPLFTDSLPNAMAVADFSGDGILDIAVVHQFSDTVIVFEGNGTDFIPPVQSFITEEFASPVLVEAGDFNEDGRPDVAAGHAFSDNTAVLINDTCCFVSVTKTGTGTGTVTSVPAGIDCGTDCAFQFSVSDTIALTAVADPGFIFTGWTGAGCSGTGGCAIGPGTSASVTATFDQLLLDVLPTSTTVGASYFSFVTPTNGSPAFTFALESGTLPPGLTLDESSGLLAGTPIQGGPFTFTIRGTDSGGATGTRTYTITVAPGATSTAPAPSLADYQDTPQIVTLVASVSNAADVDGGTVTFTVRDALSAVVGTPVTSGVVVDGSAAADYVLPGGTAPQTLVITAVYNGSASFLTSSGVADLVVQQATPAIAASNATAPFNVASQSVTLTAAVTAPGSTVNAGTVTFTVRDSTSAVVGVPVTSGTVTAGAAAANYTLPAGTAPQTLFIEAVYSGTANFLGRTDTTHTLTVTAAATTTTGANATASYSSLLPQFVALSAAVTSPGGTVNAGTVTFTVRDSSNVVIGSPVTSLTLVAGAAAANYTLPGGTNAQTLTITAVYDGSANFATSTDATHTLTVGAAVTTTAAANASAVFNSTSQVIPLSANVSSPGGPVSGGTVTFTLRDAGSNVVGAPAVSAPLAAGIAFANYTLPGGTSAQTLTITAAYSGTGNFLSSSEAAHTLTIGPAATTTAPASATAVSGPVAVTVPLTATVSSGGGTVGAGSVTFTVRTAGSVIVGSSVSGPVVAGTATANYSLPAGTPTQTLTVTADYGATTNFLASTGTSSLTVSQCGVITIGPSVLPAMRLGRPYSLTLTAAGISDPSFQLTGALPPGLSLSGATVSGTPAALGRFDVTVTGTSDSTGCSASHVFALSVMRSPLFVTGSGGPSASIGLFDDRGTQMLGTSLAADPTFAGGVRVASADLTGDGIADVIAAAGPGAPTATVQVLDGVTGHVEMTLTAYPGGSLGGLFVAAGDVNADGTPDIITGRDGANSEVRVFDGRTGNLLSTFLAYAPGVSGVRVAAGDIDADGVAEIITSPPFGSAPQVNIFSPTGVLHSSFMAYSPAWIGGLFVASGDLDGDGHADIVTGADAGGGPHVMAFSGADGHVLQSFFAYEPIFPGGVRVAAGDLNHDGYAEIITGAGPGGGPHVRAFDGATGVELVGMFAESLTMASGMFVAAPIAQGRMQVGLPAPNSTVTGSFSLVGWAALPGDTLTSGVDTVHVWAVPVAGGPPTFVGVPTLNVPRPEIAALLGGAYQESGFVLAAGPLPPGVYDLWVFARSSRSGTFSMWRIAVHVTVTP